MASVGLDPAGRRSVTLIPAPIAGVGLAPVAHAAVMGALALVIAVCLVLMARGRHRDGTPPARAGRAGTADHKMSGAAPL